MSVLCYYVFMSQIEHIVNRNDRYLPKYNIPSLLLPVLIGISSLVLPNMASGQVLELGKPGQKKLKQQMEVLIGLYDKVDSTISVELGRDPKEKRDLDLEIVSLEESVIAEATVLLAIIKTNYDFFLALCDNNESELSKVIKILETLSSKEYKGVRVFAEVGGLGDMTVVPRNPLKNVLVFLTLPSNSNTVFHEFTHFFSFDYKEEKLPKDFHEWYQSLDLKTDNSERQKAYLTESVSLLLANQLLTLKGLIIFSQSDTFDSLSEAEKDLILKELIALWNTFYPGNECLFQNCRNRGTFSQEGLAFLDSFGDHSDPIGGNRVLIQSFIAKNRGQLLEFADEYYTNPNEVFAFAFELWKGYQVARSEDSSLSVEQYIIDNISNPSFVPMVNFSIINGFLMRDSDGNWQVKNVETLLRFFNENLVLTPEQVSKYFYSN